jgi:CRISPR/Cas system-associated protein endoribonuclease Cas2
MIKFFKQRKLRKLIIKEGGLIEQVDLFQEIIKEEAYLVSKIERVGFLRNKLGEVRTEIKLLLEELGLQR